MPAPVLGKCLGIGQQAEVFAYGDRALKLLFDRPGAKGSAFREAATLAAVEAIGLPAPRVWGVVEIDGRWGIVMDRAAGMTFADRMRASPLSVVELLPVMVGLHRRIHASLAPRMSSLKSIVARNIERAPALDDALRQSLLDGLARLPDGGQLCHGDFHPMNVVGEAGAEIVLDWVDAAAGDPAADVCRSYVLIRTVDPSMAEAYLTAYAAVSGLSRSGIMSWLPFLAAARLAENVPAEQDSLLEMARRIDRAGSGLGD